MATSYKPPDDIWEVNRSLQLDEHLDAANDPRWVDTEPARGEYSLDRLRRTLGVDSARRRLTAPDNRYYLFCGHRGCGKSTELRRIAHDLHHPLLYYVVFADAAQELDVNNLRYQDVLLHLASKLVERLDKDRVPIVPEHLGKLRDWFNERVESRKQTRAFAAEAKAGAKGAVGLPFLVKIYGAISTHLKTNSTYKTELRRTLQNHFSEFSDAFNHLIEAAEQAVRDTNKGRRILLVIDGTDRLSGDDAQSFFVADVHQLQQVRGLFIYCAPVHLAYEGSPIGQNFADIFRLPMIKITNEDDSRNELGYKTMRKMLYQRAAEILFDDGVADYLIKHSGGHPRDLLRLLLNAFKHAKSDRFDLDSAHHAVREMSSEYRRMLQPEDYQVLASIDSSSELPTGTERIRNLLYNLALLEYNDYFWRSHPVIRATEEYQAAQQGNNHEREE